MDNWLVIALSIIVSAFFSGMEIAFVTSNKLKIELERSKGLVSGRIIGKFVEQPSRFIGALLLGNNIALVIYGMASAGILEPYLKLTLPASLTSTAFILFLQTLISTFFILILAEFLPKILFRLAPNRFLSLLAIPVWFFYWLLYPLIYLYTGLAEFIITRVLRINTDKERYRFTALDLNEYIRDFYNPGSEKQDGEQEIQMIQNMMEFHTTKLRECMVPRNEIVAVDESQSMEELQALFIESGHSKILTYDQTTDHMTGYVHLFDIFRNPAGIQAMKRPVVFVPETITASKVMNMLIAQRRSVAVVLDEFGGTAGMVTTEDLIEEIFGEIEDEYDVDEPASGPLGNSEFIFPGRQEIDLINREYNLDIPESAEYETLGGFIIHHHKEIPQTDDEIVIGRFTFTILDASDTRIEKVHLKINPD